MKPELGKVSVGDRLLVLVPSYNNRAGRPDPIEAVVTKVGRVWIDLERADGNGFRPTEYRLRMDTQKDGGSGNYCTRFVTAEQNAWEQRAAAAEKYLREIKLHPDYASPWSDPEQKLILANLLRAHEGLPEL